MHCRTNVIFILKSKIKLRQVCGIAAVWFNIMQAGMEVEKDQMKWWDKEMGLMATSWKNNPKREETWGQKHGVWTLTWKWSVMAACATSKIGTYPHPQSVWQGPPSCLNPSLLEGSPNSMGTLLVSLYCPTTFSLILTWSFLRSVIPSCHLLFFKGFAWFTS